MEKITTVVTKSFSDNDPREKNNKIDFMDLYVCYGVIGTIKYIKGRS